MVATTKGDASLVGDGYHVVRMDAVEEKADQPSPPNGRAKEPNSAHGGKLFERVGAQLLIVMRDIFAANGIQVIDRGVQPDRARNIRSACLEAVRSGFPGALMVIDRENHFSTAAIRGCFLEPIGAAIKDAKASRAAHFVAGKSQEIAPDLLHVDWAMTGTLSCVDQGDDAALPGAFAVLGHGIDRAKTVRDVSHGQKLNVAGEIFVELGEIEQAAVAIDRQENQLSAHALGQQLPGNDVAVMLHLGEQDFIAAFDVLGSPGVRDEVDSFGGAAGKDDFSRAADVDEFSRAIAGGFEGSRGAIAQLVDAAMNIRVVSLLVATESVKNDSRFLSRGGVIKIDQRLAVDFLIEDRKVGANFGEIHLLRL